MQIIITTDMVWLDDEASAFLEGMKADLPAEQVEEWLTNWLVSMIVPTLMGTPKADVDASIVIDGMGGGFTHEALKKT